MLVYYFVHVPGSVDDVAQGLIDRIGDMTAWARLACQVGEELRTRVQSDAGVTNDVDIVIGRPRWQSRAVFVPISWRAPGTEALFPVLDADLIVEAVGDGMTQITLRGSYKPPLRTVGQTIDRALLHRLVEACAKNFMDRIQGALDLANYAASGSIYPGWRVGPRPEPEAEVFSWPVDPGLNGQHHSNRRAFT